MFFLLTNESVSLHRGLHLAICELIVIFYRDFDRVFQNFLFFRTSEGGRGVTTFGQCRTHGGGGSKIPDFRRTSLMEAPLCFCGEAILLLFDSPAFMSASLGRRVKIL